MKRIQAGGIREEVEIRVPGSKSYTHRMLIAAALSDGLCEVAGSLESVDTTLTREALRKLGADMEQDGDRIRVSGTSGCLLACNDPIFLGNSGTSMRLLTAVAALGKGEVFLCGTERMHERPIGDLLTALSGIGVRAISMNENGCPPVKVFGGPPDGGKVALDCSLSSQFLSGLLLIAPYTRRGVEVTVTAGPVSRPYIDMTVDVLHQFGVRLEREGYRRFHVPGGQVFRSGRYRVEPDASQAGYFWAAAALTGSAVTVRGIGDGSLQGDARFPDLLEKMGCRVEREKDLVRVHGRPLQGIRADMKDMPDLVPTLAVTAAFAEGTTRIENVAHLRAKESDRLSAVATELNRMGVDARQTDDGLVVQGGSPRGAAIETYGDHRIAMSFSLAGLKVEGVVIKDEMCVEKSFPTYWTVFQQLYRDCQK